MIRVVLKFLGAFAKLRIANISFVMPACQSVRLSAYNLAPTGRISMKFDTLVFFGKL